MSRSLSRVIEALAASGLSGRPVEMPSETRTAQMAADAVGCQVDQIAKSILFQGSQSGRVFLFITAGGRTVDLEAAARLTGEPLSRAFPDAVRAATGFAIGGVAPLGHPAPLPVWFDRRLMDFDQVWAAGGTPRHVFPAEPGALAQAAAADVADFSI